MHEGVRPPGAAIWHAGSRPRAIVAVAGRAVFEAESSRESSCSRAGAAWAAQTERSGGGQISAAFGLVQRIVGRAAAPQVVEQHCEFARYSDASSFLGFFVFLFFPVDMLDGRFFFILFENVCW